MSSLKVIFLKLSLFDFFLLEARTPSLKFLFESTCFQEVSDSARMIRDILDVLILCFLNTRLLSLVMAVSGIFMMDASMLKCQSPMLIIGRKSSMAIGNVISIIRKSLRKWDGMFSPFGSVN